jgi:hypothetical protein
MEMLFISLANGEALGIGVFLINGDEFGTKTKSYNGNFYPGHRLFLLSSASKRAPLFFAYENAASKPKAHHNG